MKSTLLTLCLFFALSFSSKATNVLITENTLYVCDTIWKHVANGMGMNSIIQSDTFLDNTYFLTHADVVIIATYNVNYTPTRVNNIKQFLASGKSVYLQTEYDCTNFPSDAIYEDIVNSLGGSFTRGGTISGMLNVNVLGNMATTPNTVTQITDFWYGCQGIASCTNMDAFLELSGNYFGFTFCPPINGYGRLMTTTDQDWVRSGLTMPLIGNMLNLLASPPSNCGLPQTSLNLGNDTTLCSGQFIMLGNGVTGNNYQWSTGQTSNVILVNSPGTYWLSVSNSGCTQSDTITVNFSNCNYPTSSFSASVLDICTENCTDFTDQSSNNPTSWAWSFPGGNPTSSTVQNPTHICYTVPGVYPVTLISTNASGSDTLTMDSLITVYLVPPQPTVTVHGDTLVTTGGASYQWFFNNQQISGATDSFYVATQQGSYSVEIADIAGCINTSTDVIMSVDEAGFASSILLFPNPSNGELNIKGLPANAEKIEVFDAIGKLVDFFELSTSELNVPTNHYEEGVYFVRILSGSNSYSKRFTVLHQ